MFRSYYTEPAFGPSYHAHFNTQRAFDDAHAFVIHQNTEDEPTAVRQLVECESCDTFQDSDDVDICMGCDTPICSECLAEQRLPSTFASALCPKCHNMK